MIQLSSVRRRLSESRYTHLGSSSRLGPAAGLCFLLLLPTLSPAAAGTGWNTWLMPHPPDTSVGRSPVMIGVGAGLTDGWDGEWAKALQPDSPAVAIGFYRPTWPAQAQPAGFFWTDLRSPLAPGGSNTWRDIYLWAQNYTVAPSNQVEVRTSFESGLEPPAGYRGHLVLDYVPPSAGWTGTTEFWLDLNQYWNRTILPVVRVDDPLQGTRFHLTVYAPIPEPSSLAALALAIAAIGPLLRHRRDA